MNKKPIQWAIWYSDIVILWTSTGFFSSTGNLVLQKPLPRCRFTRDKSRIQSVLHCTTYIFKTEPQCDALIATRRICWYYWYHSKDFTEYMINSPCSNIWLYIVFTWSQNMWAVWRRRVVWFCLEWGAGFLKVGACFHSLHDQSDTAPWWA